MDNPLNLELVKQELQLEHGRTEPEIIAELAERVAYMIDKEPDLLFSYFYRMDIPESKVQQILMGLGDRQEPASYALARLIYQRQVTRLLTKQRIKVDPQVEDWAE